jgi:hypothetical protein
MAGFSFNASQVEPRVGTPPPVPNGDYILAIDKAEISKVKGSRTDDLLTLRFNILEGEYANRKIFVRLNIKNKNKQAEDIAHGELSAICHAIGILQIESENHLQKLYGIPVKSRVGITPEKDGYAAQNKIMSYESVSEIIKTEVTPQIPQQAIAPEQWQQPVQQQAPNPWANQAPNTQGQQAPQQTLPWGQQAPNPWANQAPNTQGQPQQTPPWGQQPPANNPEAQPWNNQQSPPTSPPWGQQAPQQQPTQQPPVNDPNTPPWAREK